jgi:cysteine desulfurase / selenocysteine lyase
VASPDEALELCRACVESAQAITMQNIREHVVGVENLVPLADGREVRYVNLDNAATTPPLSTVVDCSRFFFEWYASVHRGSGLKSLISTHVYEHCREVIAAFVGADPAVHALVFTQNATHALNKLAMRICSSAKHPQEHVVLTTVMEHHSNMLPWRKLGCEVHYAAIHREDGTLDMANLEEKLRRYAGRLCLVAVSGASNVTGILPPIRRIARLAHEHGAMIAVDATQLIPHRAFQMGAPDDPERIDFIAFSGHKMYAPFGAGVLVGPRHVFEDSDPDTVGGGTVSAVTTDEVLWAPLPEREEAGTPNAPGALALGCATKVLTNIGMDAVAEHERELTRRALRRLTRIPGLQLYGLKDPDVREDRLGVISMNADRFPHSIFAAVLGHEWGIGVRNGCFCAQPYVRELLGVSDEEMRRLMTKLAAGDHATVPGMVRISFGVYNTPEEVDYAADAIEQILTHGPRANYVLDQQHMDYVPHPSIVRLDDYLPI